MYWSFVLNGRPSELIVNFQLSAFLKYIVYDFNKSKWASFLTLCHWQMFLTGWHEELSPDCKTPQVRLLLLQVPGLQLTELHHIESPFDEINEAWTCKIVENSRFTRDVFTRFYHCIKYTVVLEVNECLGTCLDLVSRFGKSCAFFRSFSRSLFEVFFVFLSSHSLRRLKGRLLSSKPSER